MLFDLSEVTPSPQTASLRVVTPTTGNVELEREWTAPQRVSVATGSRTYYPDPLDHLISPDYAYLAASQEQDDGTLAAGVLSADGTFTNVSAAVTKGGFAGGLGVNRQLFSGDRFYFNAFAPGQNQDTVYSLPAADTTKDDLSASDFRVELKGDDALMDFVVSPNGAVSAASSCQRTPWGIARFARALLGKRGYLEQDDNQILLRKYVSGCEPNYTKGTPLLPETSQQLLSFVASPDTGSLLVQTLQGSQVSYYRVPLPGGSPQLIDGLSDVGSQYVLAGWR